MISGVITNTSKRGKGYNIKVDDEWYGYGFDDPADKGHIVGVAVEFNYTEKHTGKGTFKNVDNSTIKVLNDAPAQTTKNGNKAPSAGSRDQYWADKEARDIKDTRGRRMGAARSQAMEFVKLLIDVGAFKVPTKGDKTAIIEGLVNEYAEEFYFKNLSVVEDDEYDDFLSMWLQQQEDTTTPAADDDDEEEEATDDNIG